MTEEVGMQIDGFLMIAVGFLLLGALYSFGSDGFWDMLRDKYGIRTGPPWRRGAGHFLLAMGIIVLIVSLWRMVLDWKSG
jgi:hypothetical protein